MSRAMGSLLLLVAELAAEQVYEPLSESSAVLMISDG